MLIFAARAERGRGGLWNERCSTTEAGRTREVVEVENKFCVREIRQNAVLAVGRPPHARFFFFSYCTCHRKTVAIVTDPFWMSKDQSSFFIKDQSPRGVERDAPLPVVMPPCHFSRRSWFGFSNLNFNSFERKAFAVTSLRHNHPIKIYNQHLPPRPLFPPEISMVVHRPFPWSRVSLINLLRHHIYHRRKGIFSNIYSGVHILRPMYPTTTASLMATESPKSNESPVTKHISGGLPDGTTPRESRPDSARAGVPVATEGSRHVGQLPRGAHPIGVWGPGEADGNGLVDERSDR